MALVFINYIKGGFKVVPFPCQCHMHFRELQSNLRNLFVFLSFFWEYPVICNCHSSVYHVPGMSVDLERYPISCSWMEPWPAFVHKSVTKVACPQGRHKPKFRLDQWMQVKIAQWNSKESYQVPSYVAININYFHKNFLKDKDFNLINTLPHEATYLNIILNLVWQKVIYYYYQVLQPPFQKKSPSQLTPYVLTIHLPLIFSKLCLFHTVNCCRLNDRR